MDICTDLFAETFGGGVFRSTDNGVNWIPVSNGLTHIEVLSFAVKNNNLFAGTWNGGVFLSTDNGSVWTPISDDYPVLPW